MQKRKFYFQRWITASTQNLSLYDIEAVQGSSSTVPWFSQASSTAVYVSIQPRHVRPCFVHIQKFTEVITCFDLYKNTSCKQTFVSFWLIFVKNLQYRKGIILEQKDVGVLLHKKYGNEQTAMLNILQANVLYSYSCEMTFDYHWCHCLYCFLIRMLFIRHHCLLKTKLLQLIYRHVLKTWASTAGKKVQLKFFSLLFSSMAGTTLKESWIILYMNAYHLGHLYWFLNSS